MSNDKMKRSTIFAFIIIFLVSLTFAQRVIIKEVEPEETLKSLRVYEDVKENLNVTHEFTSFKGYEVEVSKEQIEELKKNPNYEILSDKRYTITLDVSNPQVKANDTWILKQNDTNLTGLYQTVCIIDTGVNYSHINLGGCYGENNPDSGCKVLGGYDFINNDAYPMDDNGHGTHVAGIISSNDSTYEGIAPNVKIIAMKALDASGNGITLNLNRSINWCIDNASKFNISVISLSLGAINKFYNSYCNSWDSNLTLSIQRAIQNNITVVSSSGNCKNASDQYTEPLCHTGISAPGCIEGVIPVGSIHSNDLTINYQRGDLYQILAPGGGPNPTDDFINSLDYNGGITSMRGTSQSAPHVAAAVAILKQFYTMQSNKNMTNSQVKSALNITDKWIDDTDLSGHYFPRLNILTAVYSLDEVAPNVTLYYPANQSLSQNVNQTFKANLSDLQLYNLTFFLWNSSEIVNTTSASLSGAEEDYEINITNLPQGETYYWTVQSYDENNNSYTAQNYTITIGEIETNQGSPGNNNYTNVNDTNFTCSGTTAEGTNLSNITFYIFNQTTLIYNETENVSGTYNSTMFNYTLPSETNYTWYCVTMNNVSDSGKGDNYTITLDTTSPNLTIETPLPTSVTSNSVSKIFYFNASDNSVDLNCSLIFTTTINAYKTIENYSITNNFTRTLTPATYNWLINCSDLAGNYNTSYSNSFTITAEESGGSTGGGGGGSTEVKGTITNPLTPEDLKEGSTQTYSSGKKVYFNNSYKEQHTLTLNKIEGNKLNITIQSDPINLVLKNNQSVKLNLSNKRYLDTLVEAIGITGSYAIIKIKEINETNPDYIEEAIERNYTIQDDVNQTNNETDENNEGSKNSIPIVQILIIIFVVLLVIFLIIMAIRYIKEDEGEDKGTREVNIKKTLEKSKKENDKRSKKDN